MTGISLAGLTKEFDDVTAVDGVDLDIREGEFLVLVGPSGCGKSTTLRLLAGLETATSGTVSINDRDVTDREASDRNVAMVFQNYALYPHMSAKRNMTFGLGSATDFSDDEIERRVADAAGVLDIEDLLDRKPAALSGGEKQRVAIGRALVRDPEVFLMDEPLSNLDAKLRVQMRAELAELHTELRTTTLYVTHDQVEAMTLGDRVAVMNNGHLQQVAPPQLLYDRPETRFVAEFIGSPGMNTVQARLDTTGDRTAAVWGDIRVDLPDPNSVIPRSHDESVVFGARPESLFRDPAGPIELEVSATEPLGDSTLVRGTAAGHEMEVSLNPHADAHPGDTVALSPDPERVHLFDAETGEAVYHSAPHLDAVDDAAVADARTAQSR
jgi:multiple sugar transport system ATP-binding protein